MNGGEEHRAGTEGLPDGFSEMLEKVLSNPALMQMAAAMAVGSGTSEPKEERAENDEAKAVQAAPALPDLTALTALLGAEGAQRSLDDPRMALLQALSPCLRPSRQRLLQQMIRWGRVYLLVRPLLTERGDGHVSS